MIGFVVIVYWVTALISRKNHADMKEEIKETNRKLIRSYKHFFNIKPIIKNNFDIKPTILRWFFASFCFNFMFISLMTAINIVYAILLFANFFNYSLGSNFQLSWIVTLVLNVLYFLFLLRLISDYYKLSLRGKYRRSYLKLLTLDILTVNLFSVIGSLIFAKNKSQILQVNDNEQINHDNLTSQSIKNFLKLIFKVEIFILFVNLLIFGTVAAIGYFVVNNTVKLVCIVISVLNLMFLYGWVVPRLVAMLIFQKMFKNLINNNETQYLLMTVRFLVFGSGYYYFAVLLHLFKFDENSMNFILENW